MKRRIAAGIMGTLFCTDCVRLHASERYQFGRAGGGNDRN